MLKHVSPQAWPSCRMCCWHQPRGMAWPAPTKSSREKGWSSIGWICCQTVLTGELLCREVPAGHAPRLPSMETLVLLLPRASSRHTNRCLLCSAQPEAAAVQLDVVLRLELTEILVCLSFGHHAAGLQQHWQHSSAPRVQVQEVQPQVQLLQLNPIWSVILIPASQPSMAAHPLNLCHTGQQRCASCPTNTRFACVVVLRGRPMP